MKMLQTHQLARPDHEVEDVERMLSAYCKSYDPTRDEVMKIFWNAVGNTYRPRMFQCSHFAKFQP